MVGCGVVRWGGGGGWGDGGWARGGWVVGVVVVVGGVGVGGEITPSDTGFSIVFLKI